MLTFREYLHHVLVETYTRWLFEGNPLGRLKQHIDNNRHFSAISAERSHLSPAQNKGRMKALKQKLRAMGYGFKRARGQWEGGGEESLVVHAKGTGRTHGRQLKRDMRSLSKHFNQDAVMHHGGSGKSAEASLHGTNKTGWPGKNKKVPVGKVKFNRPSAPFQTSLRGGKKSTASFTTEPEKP